MKKRSRRIPPEELIALAKEHGAELTAEEANTYFAQLHPASGELSDDELDNVSGGRKCGTIYKDGRLVVTALNKCEYFKDLETGKVRPNDGYCKDCHYCREDPSGWLWLCYHPKRYNN